MNVVVETTPLKDLLIVRHEVFRDDRGFFMEVFREDLYREAGLPARFVQLNHSRSTKGVLRGLHFQWEPPMGKLMRVTVGQAFLVAVDIRKDSPTLGKWYGRVADAHDFIQIYAPAGFARGFCVLSDVAEIQYLTTGTYNAAGESGFSYRDPDIGVEWPVSDPIVSAKDSKAPSFAEWLSRPESDRFTL